ncbi:transposase family protein [Streptomyces sp. GQFP]|uniref:transposase family protein n=1 Tax=Streptomyces sp. GQFP TaxID=2907545 RepID=UPI003FA690E3
MLVLLDGTRRRTGADNRRNYSGKHKAHGLLFLALTDEKGNLIWISSARPGRSSEITTARHDKITTHLREAGLGALADLGFVGLDDQPDDDPVIITEPQGHPQPPAHRRGEGGEPPAQPRTRGRRARLRQPQDLAHPHQGPHEHPPRDDAPAGPPRPGEHRSAEVTDDLPRTIMMLTGTSPSPPTHTSPVTCEIRMKISQG